MGWNLESKGRTWKAREEYRIGHLDELYTSGRPTYKYGF